MRTDSEPLVQVCARCKGSGIDPEQSHHRYANGKNEPEPCLACGGDGEVDLNAPAKSIAGVMALQFPEAVPSPCNDCPWRRDATQGWLGPYSAESWLEVAHGESAIACHQTIPDGGGWGPKTKQCRGAAIFRANVCKRARNPTVTFGPIDHDQVFSSNQEFLAHHKDDD